MQHCTSVAEFICFPTECQLAQLQLEVISKHGLITQEDAEDDGGDNAAGGADDPEKCAQPDKPFTQEVRSRGSSTTRLDSTRLDSTRLDSTRLD